MRLYVLQSNLHSFQNYNNILKYRIRATYISEHLIVTGSAVSFKGGF